MRSLKALCYYLGNYLEKTERYLEKVAGFRFLSGFSLTTSEFSNRQIGPKKDRGPRGTPARPCLHPCRRDGPAACLFVGTTAMPAAAVAEELSRALAASDGLEALLSSGVAAARSSALHASLLI